jgi:hypothetical protein
LGVKVQFFDAIFPHGVVFLHRMIEKLFDKSELEVTIAGRWEKRFSESKAKNMEKTASMVLIVIIFLGNAQTNI